MKIKNRNENFRSWQFEHHTPAELQVARAGLTVHRLQQAIEGEQHRLLRDKDAEKIRRNIRGYGRG